MIDPRLFFEDIILDLIPDIVMSENDRLVDRFNNKMNPFNKKASLGGRLQNVPPVKIKQALIDVGIRRLNNTICPQIKHLTVLQQHRGGECGFHMLFNAKCLIKAFISTKQYDQVVNLINLSSNRVFLADVRRTKKLLLKCTNSYFVSDDDKKQLRSHRNAILDRSHLNYLLKYDPELLEFQKP